MSRQPELIPAKRSGLDEDREDRILDALACFREDILDEISKLRRALAQTVNHSVLITSQHGDYTDCDETIYGIDDNTDQRSVSEAANERADPVPIDCSNAPERDEQAGVCGINLSKKLMKDFSINSNNNTQEKRNQDDPSPLSSFYDKNSEVLYGSSTMEEVKQEAVEEHLGYSGNNFACGDIEDIAATDLSRKARLPITSSFEISCSSNFKDTMPVQETSLSLQTVFQASGRDDSEYGTATCSSSVSSSSMSKSQDFSEAEVATLLPRSYPEHLKWKEGVQSSSKSSFQCKLCSKIYSSHSSFARHKRSHTKEKCFNCKTCNKFFPSRSSFVMHERIHTGEKPFRCEVCEKSFSAHSNLKVHMRTHTGEKPFTCGTCFKSFSCTTNLKVHTRTHTGEKPYHCDVCYKPFTRLNYLQHHVQVSHTQNLLTTEKTQ